MGGVIGFILDATGASQKIIILVVTPIALVLGLCLSVVLIKLIPGKNFGEFRLAMLAKQ